MTQLEPIGPVKTVAKEATRRTITATNYSTYSPALQATQQHVVSRSPQHGHQGPPPFIHNFSDNRYCPSEHQPDPARSPQRILLQYVSRCKEPKRSPPLPLEHAFRQRYMSNVSLTQRIPTPPTLSITSRTLSRSRRRARATGSLSWPQSAKRALRRTAWAPKRPARPP